MCHIFSIKYATGYKYRNVSSVFLLIWLCLLKNILKNLLKRFCSVVQNIILGKSKVSPCLNSFYNYKIRSYTIMSVPAFHNNGCRFSAGHYRCCRCRCILCIFRKLEWKSRTGNNCIYTGFNRLSH